MENVERSHPSLRGDLDVDVAVIGGGLTGLSSAIFLAREGMSVALLEKDLVGAGASGRNCGQVGSEIGRNLVALKSDLGTDRAGNVVRVLRAAIENLERFIDQEKIDCAYQRHGNIFAGIHITQQKFADQVACVAEEYGFPVKRIGPGDAQKMGLPAAVVCGFHDQTGGTLDPARLVKGLAKTALQAGRVKIFEETPVVEVVEGRKIVLKTPQGSVRADLCVLATNGYSPEIGYLKRKILPAYVSVAITDPLSDAQFEKLGWTRVGGLYTAHHVIENLRLTPDRRLLVGTKKVRVGFGTRPPAPNSRRTFSALQGVLDDRFPELDGIKIAMGWTGRVAVTSDSVPIMGRLGVHKNILYSAGYSGHGIAMAAYAGHHIAALHAGRSLGDAAILESRRVIPIPPEPIRWLGANALFGVLSRKDAATDRLLRASRKLQTTSNGISKI